MYDDLVEVEALAVTADECVNSPPPFPSGKYKRTLARLYTLVGKTSGRAQGALERGENQTLEQIDQRLAKMKLGLACWADEEVDIPKLGEYELDEDGTHTGWVLGYHGFPDGRHLAARRVRMRSEEREQPWGMEEIWWTMEVLIEPVPLVKAPRAVRVWSTSILEGFMKKLAEKAEGYVESIGKAKKLAG